MERTHSETRDKGLPGHAKYRCKLIGAKMQEQANTSAPAQAESKKPNIVFILKDNLGYGELGAYGGGILRGAPTPRIDKLASEGLRLIVCRDESA